MLLKVSYFRFNKSFVSSNKKIGFYGDTSNQNRLIKKITNSWYSELIRIGNYEENLPHEVITNNFFLKHLNINTKPKIFNVKKNPSYAIKIQSRYFVIFPGSANPLRNWKVENFINIAKLICEKYKLAPVICGTSSEISLSKKNYLYKHKFKLVFTCWGNINRSISRSN